MAARSTLIRYEDPLDVRDRCAVAGFLATHIGDTRVSYTTDLRLFAGWCADSGVRLLEVRRAHLEIVARLMEQVGPMRSTVARRLSTLCSFYRYCDLEGLLARVRQGGAGVTDRTVEPTSVRRDRIHPGGALPIRDGDIAMRRSISKSNRCDLTAPPSSSPLASRRTAPLRPPHPRSRPGHTCNRRRRRQLATRRRTDELPRGQGRATATGLTRAARRPARRGRDQSSPRRWRASARCPSPLG